MKLSARNQLVGTVKTVGPGATTTHVTIEVAPWATINASITNESSDELGSKPDMKDTAVIKASNVGRRRLISRRHRRGASPPAVVARRAATRRWQSATE